MLGWMIIIHAQIPGVIPTEDPNTHGRELARWDTGIYGLDWVTELEKEGKATAFYGCGYPDIYVANAADILAKISARPPAPKGPVVLSEDGEALPNDKVVGDTRDEDAIAQCPPDEYLTIVAWDLS